jgi:hypothetical protein
VINRGLRAFDVPGCGSIADLEAETDGTLGWITEAPRDAILRETEPWRRTADGKIRRVIASASELDDPIVPRRIFVRGPDDVWMAAPGRWRDEVLWHSGPARREVELTDDVRATRLTPQTVRWLALTATRLVRDPAWSRGEGGVGVRCDDG